MQVTTKFISETKAKLTITADQKLLDDVKNEALEHLGKDHVKIQGFRQGKAPLHLVEKQVDQNLLQSEFLERAVNRMYVAAISHEQLRTVDKPAVNITKFVPFTTLELTAEVEAIGDIRLPDYTSIRLPKPAVKVTNDDVKAVLDDLALKMATKQDVSRSAKDGDEVTIDFSGIDTKTKEPIAGADGKDFPLQLGSNTFIPGFEDNLVGMKATESKTFSIAFPKDYGIKALQRRNVTFDVTVKLVKEITKPTIDDALAAKAGAFTSLAELKADIKKQLGEEKQQQADREYENQLLEHIAMKTTVAVPALLVNEEVDRQIEQAKQNALYRGQTWQEYLAAEQLSEEKLREDMRATAELRVRAGICLSEIAEKEHVSASEAEVDERLQALRNQYSDPAMQAEIDKPETRRELRGRILSEKTMQLLVKLASKK